jgi:SAM-dependent methyltransferase
MKRLFSKLIVLVRDTFPFLVPLLLRLPNSWVFFFRNRRVKGRPMQEVFSEIFEDNLWHSDESHSGYGATVEATERLREGIPKILKDVGAKSLLDIPCGDFNWLSTVELGIENYIGADLVPALVEKTRAEFVRDDRIFVVLDVTTDDLPKADVVMCKDLLTHLSTDFVLKALKNIKRSGADYLLTTTFTGISKNQDIPVGSFRPLNMQAAPFAFPEPLHIIDEGHEAKSLGRSLAAWRVSDIPDFQNNI